MTERWVIENGEIKDTRRGMTFDSFMEIVIVLNGQSETIRQLQLELKALNKKYNAFSEATDKRLKEMRL